MLWYLCGSGSDSSIIQRYSSISSSVAKLIVVAVTSDVKCQELALMASERSGALCVWDVFLVFTGTTLGGGSLISRGGSLEARDRVFH